MPNVIHKFANPARFMRIAEPVLPWISVGAVLSIVLALYFGIFASPADYQQGETVRIMYVHVPAAWMALFIYTILSLIHI